MPESVLVAFFIGFSTAYFAIFAYQINFLWEGRHMRLNRLLGACFAYWTLTNVKDLVLTVPGFYSRFMLDNIIMIDGWSFIAYTCMMFEITMPGWVTKKRIALLAIPFVLFMLVYILCPTTLVVDVYLAFLTIGGLSMLAIGYTKAIKYIKYIRNNYSNIEELDISWVKYVCIIAAILQILWLCASLLGKEISDCFYYALNIVFSQIIVAHCRKLKPIMLQAEEPGLVPEERIYAFEGVVEKMVEDEQLYLNPNLSLADLTRRLGTNRTYLSDYFTNVKGISFYDFVNSMRINKKSVPMIKEHPEYTFDYVAMQSGFNSLSTFRRAFVKFTGKTPGHYRETESGCRL